MSRKLPRAVDQVVTVDEAALIVGVSVRRLRELLAAGQLPGRQTSAGVWLIARADAEAFERRPKGRPKAS